MSNNLQDHMANLPPGPVEDTKTLEVLLAKEWHGLDGSSAGGMYASKIAGRCEQLQWNPPYVTFIVERHGGTVNGSTRGELQHWSVDVSARSAVIVKSGRRQLYPMSKRFDAAAAAKELVEAIASHRESASLKWYPDGRVKVNAREVVPIGVKQTTTERRARLRGELDAGLARCGWVSVSPFTYQQSPSP